MFFFLDFSKHLNAKSNLNQQANDKLSLTILKFLENGEESKSTTTDEYLRSSK